MEDIQSEASSGRREKEVQKRLLPGEGKRLRLPLDVRHRTNSKRRLYGRRCNGLQGWRGIARAQLRIVRKDRTQNATGIFDADQSGITRYVRHNSTSFAM